MLSRPVLYGYINVDKIVQLQSKKLAVLVSSNKNVNISITPHL